MPISSHCFWPWLSRPAVRWPRASGGSGQQSRRCGRAARRQARNRLARTRRSAAGQLQVLEHAELLVDRGLLELAADADLRDVGLAQAQQVDGAAEEAVPLSGRVLPVMQSIIVVLPAPLGPMMQRSSPTLMVSVSVQRLEAVEADVISSRYSATPCVKSGSPFATRP
jgi:hypothetical protein